jgi:hypothetical protein
MPGLIGVGVWAEAAIGAEQAMVADRNNLWMWPVGMVVVSPLEQRIPIKVQE